MASGRTTWQREQREGGNAVSVNDVPLSLSEHNIYNDTSFITISQCKVYDSEIF